MGMWNIVQCTLEFSCLKFSFLKFQFLKFQALKFHSSELHLTKPFRLLLYFNQGDSYSLNYSNFSDFSPRGTLAWSASCHATTMSSSIVHDSTNDTQWVLTASTSSTTCSTNSTTWTIWCPRVLCPFDHPQSSWKGLSSFGKSSQICTCWKQSIETTSRILPKCQRSSKRWRCAKKNVWPYIQKKAGAFHVRNQSWHDG